MLILKCVYIFLFSYVYVNLLMSSCFSVVSCKTLSLMQMPRCFCFFQGFFSCVAAPDMMRGGLTQRINFPQWLGKNSSQGKHDRILQELKTHMRLR